MPYFSEQQVEKAIVYLGEHAHQSLVSLLSMLRIGVPTTDDENSAITFGARQENELLDAFFKPVGGSEDKPFYIPFGNDGGKPRWHDASYAGSSLQRQRKDRSSVFAQPKGDNKRWYLKPSYVGEVASGVAGKIGDDPISLPALAAWMLRKAEFQTIDEVVQRLIDELSLDRDGLISAGGVFTRDDLSGVGTLELSDEMIDDEVLIDILAKHSPAPKAVADNSEMAPSSGGVIHSAASPGSWDVDAALLAKSSGLEGVEEPARRAIAALRSGMHVIFTGPPGTGKTTLAEAVCRAAGFPSWTVPATDQWTTFETIGGYFPTPDDSNSSADRLDFLPGAVVDAIERQRCLIIDEINRADIDKAFGELFTLLTGKSVTLPYRRRSDAGFHRIRLQFSFGIVEEDITAIAVPDWWRIIGAMNDSDKASLKRLSLAFVRRFAFVPLDIPSAEHYGNVIDRTFGELDPVQANKLSDLQVCVRALFVDRTVGLGAIGLPMGPGIPLAMIRHGLAESEMDSSRSVAEIVRSCIDLYLIPQFQGRPDKHSDISTLLAPYYDDIDGFERHLGVWTGVGV
jgi:5-methylcytosine-specific restriction enzyme B